MTHWADKITGQNSAFWGRYRVILGVLAVMQ